MPHQWRIEDQEDVDFLSALFVNGRHPCPWSRLQVNLCRCQMSCFEAEFRACLKIKVKFGAAHFRIKSISFICKSETYFCIENGSCKTNLSLYDFINLTFDILHPYTDFSIHLCYFITFNHLLIYIAE